MVETTQMSINEWIHKENVIHPYGGILSSLEKEGNSDSGYNMDESWGHYTHWNNKVTKDTYCRTAVTWGPRLVKLM